MKKLQDMNKDELINEEELLTNKLKQTSGEKRQITLMKKIKDIKKYMAKLDKANPPLIEEVVEETEKEFQKPGFFQRLLGRR